MKICRVAAFAVLSVSMGLFASSGLAQTVPKIGVFDSKTVFEQAAEGQRLQELLNSKRDEFRVNIQAKEAEVEGLKQRLREGEFTLSDDKKAELQKDLQRKLVELDAAKQEANNNLRIELEDVQSQLERKLLEVVEEVGAEQNFAIILEKNTQVVFSSPAMDISQTIVERFNSKFPARSGAGGSD